MGLAASQARLLTITARKGDCEFQSMTLSHQKLQMSRDLENISAEYQEALNATKLVFGYSSGVDISSYDVTSSNYTNGNVNLTYSALMTPSAYNEYYPKMVTDSANRCILDASLATAARAAGIPAEGLGCTPSSDLRDAFIDAIADENIITKTQAAVIHETPYAYSIGNGETASITTSYAEISSSELMDMLNAYSCDTDDYGLQFGLYYRTSLGNAGLYDESVYCNSVSEELISTGGNTSSKPNTETDVQSFNLKTLLSSDDSDQIVLSYSMWCDTNLVGAAALQDQLAGVEGNLGNGSFLDYLMEQFSNVLGGVQQNEEAIAYAYDAMYDLIVPNEDIQKLANYDYLWDGDSKEISSKTQCGDIEESITGNSLTFKEEMELLGNVYQCSLDEVQDESWQEDIAEDATNSIGISSSCYADKHHRVYSQVSVSLNNIAQAFLTKIVEYLDGGVGCSEYYANKGTTSLNSNLFDINNDDFTFTTVDTVEVDDGDDNYYSRFYDAMFNQICLNGWVENDEVDDYDYLSEMFKNGQAFINSISNDGYYYQGNYSSLNFVSEVSDESKIAAAEAKYNAEKARLENKEDTIDIKMKNLDTEISSLTTEYDTVKSVISKAIEKSFKRYDA